MNREDFIARHPRLFHMAAADSWPSIQRHGLLSTSALVDLYDPTPAVRHEILETVRRRSYVLSYPGLDDATVRDQLPLKFIDRCLFPGVTTQEFLDALNTRVFFHVDEERLLRLLNARAYRNKVHDVLMLDTATFLGNHPNVELAPYNTGSVHVPNMPPRGPETFEPLEDYSLPYWERIRGSKDAIVELTVRHSAQLGNAVLSASQWHHGARVS
ncbi:hypothetical protein QBL02_10885 [Leucobacter sp. UT-8R-CII-1-4]|uniref:DUF7002 family protein n=1 Tax=Leucobacter sp. UT-8R-CII-1-4 TaxID=3040075 RepID=UPI0024A982C8|nr:hypothetical protein [Leucobacter sp. UT-8R-CII-1-4]MDI6024050.1 hypothetical protein [Leucobacter sp. UT-8R-CII-1-4]